MVQAQDDGESTVDVVELIPRQQALRLAKPARVDSSQLLYQHSGASAVNFHFWSE
jgi:hypothetical protein